MDAHIADLFRELLGMGENRTNAISEIAASEGLSEYAVKAALIRTGDVIIDRTIGGTRGKKCIIKYYCSFLGDEDRVPQWAVCGIAKTSTHGIEAKWHDITREKALDFIKQNGLVLVHKDRNGEVYDTPDKAFRTAYHDRVIKEHFKFQ